MIRLSHFCISSTNIKNSKHFFISLFNATVIYEFTKNNLHYGSFLKIDKNTFVEIFLSPVVEVNQYPTIRHVCLSVDSLEPFKERLQIQNFHWEQSVGRIDNTKQLMIIGPEGLKIELHQIDESSILFYHL